MHLCTSYEGVCIWATKHCLLVGKFSNFMFSVCLEHGTISKGKALKLLCVPFPDSSLHMDSSKISIGFAAAP